MRIDAIAAHFAETSDDGILIARASNASVGECDIIWCNATAAQMFGGARDTIVGQTLASIWPDQGDHDDARAMFDDLVHGHEDLHEIQFRQDHGAPVWWDCRLTHIAEDGDTQDLLVITFRNVTHRVVERRQLEMSEQAAQETQERLLSAIEALPDGFVMYDSEDRMILCNERYRKTYEATGSAIQMGETFRTILREGLANGQYPEAVGREDDWLEERLDRHFNPRGPIIQELPGNRFLKIHEVKTGNSDIVGFRADITELKRQEQELKKKAKALQFTMTELDIASRTDALTNLGNRRGLDLMLSYFAEVSNPDDKIAFLHLDLDRFKPINDVFGHAAGDYVLKIVADILRSSVSPSDYVARVGGDEFAILIASGELADVSTNAHQVASRIIAACATPLDWQGNSLMFGTSIGIAIDTIDSVGRLMQDADIALYNAKDAGRNQAVLFTPELRRALEHRQNLADEFLNGFDTGEIVAFYQPQVDALTHQTIGVEALVRWEHPRNGVMAPGQFLPIVEDLGLLGDLDHLVLLHALDTARQCSQQGLHPPKVGVNMSYSRIQMLSELDSLQELQPFPCELSFELLETIDFDDAGGISAWTLDGFREMGIGIEIDDFGSGHASLTTLLKIRPDRIKIDRQIVNEVGATNDGAMSLVRAIGEMARGLGIAMTAEGIETAEQANYMRDMGCDVLQGYYFAKPMSRSDLITRLGGRPERRAQQRA